MKRLLLPHNQYTSDFRNSSNYQVTIIELGAPKSPQLTFFYIFRLNIIMIFDRLYESLKSTLLSAEEKFLEFLDKRAAGAAKLAASSKKKGGYALPTAIHFAAKARPYAECVKHKDDEEYIKA